MTVVRMGLPTIMVNHMRHKGFSAALTIEGTFFFVGVTVLQSYTFEGSFNASWWFTNISILFHSTISLKTSLPVGQEEYDLFLQLKAMTYHEIKLNAVPYDIIFKKASELSRLCEH